MAKIIPGHVILTLKLSAKGRKIILNLSRAQIRAQFTKLIKKDMPETTPKILQ
jgi:hypothetical protein